MLAQVCHNLLEPAVQDDVHAAILMTTDHQSAKAKIITVASGTGFCKRSAAKSAVFDCHAEMLVRKGLIEFLFKQMETAGTPSSIFTRAAGKYSLKDAGCTDRISVGESNVLQSEILRTRCLE